MSKRRNKQQNLETPENGSKEARIQEYNTLVCNISDRILDLVREELKALTPKVRWLIYGRILNVLFQSHYGVCMNLTEETIKLNTDDYLKDQ